MSKALLEETIAYECHRQRCLIEVDRALVTERLAAVLGAVSQELFEAGIGIGRLEAITNLSRHTLQRDFKRQLDITVMEYINRNRMAVACRLLSGTEAPVWLVGSALGFKTADGFSRAFTRSFKIRPHEYRETNCAPKRARCSEARERRSFIESRALDILSNDLRNADPKQIADVIERGYSVDPRVAFGELLSQSRQVGESDRRQGIKFARLALSTLPRLSDEVEQNELRRLRIEGLICLGNCCRSAADWRMAEQAFAAAERELDGGRGGTADLNAETLMNKGHLRTYQRRFSEADELLGLARREWEKLGNGVGLARTISACGYSFWVRGDWASAFELYAEAERQLAKCEQGNTHLLVSVLSGIAGSAAALGEFSAARRNLSEAKTLAGQLLNQDVAATLRWQEGLIEIAQGRERQGEVLLVSAKGELCDAEQPFHGALVSVDLAIVFLRQERHDDAMDQLEYALPILAGLELENEGVLALRLTNEAIAKKALSVEVMGRLRSLLAIRLGAPALPHSENPLPSF